MKTIKFKTNTGFLLNMWFTENSCFQKEKEAIEKLHKENWEENKSFHVEVIIKRCL